MCGINGSKFCKRHDCFVFWHCSPTLWIVRGCEKKLPRLVKRFYVKKSNVNIQLIWIILRNPNPFIQYPLQYRNKNQHLWTKIGQPSIQPGKKIKVEYSKEDWSQMKQVLTVTDYWCYRLMIPYRRRQKCRLRLSPCYKRLYTVE